MMHIRFVLALVFSATVLAAPISTLSLQDRDNSGIEICGLPARADVQKGCLENPLRFVFENSKLTAAPKGAQPAGTECDHSLELQVLKRGLEASSACTALDGILTAGAVNNAETKNTLLKPLFDAINAESNTVFLDKAVNAQKRLVVQHALATPQPPKQSTDVLKAVQTYLKNSKIKKQTNALASSLDKLTKQMLSDAQKEAEKAIDAKPGATARQKSAQTSAKTAVNDAVERYESLLGVAKQWKLVLTYAA